MSQVALSFPDETYSSSNKPSVLTLKADLTAIETAHNDTDTNAVTATGVATLTNKTLTAPIITTPTIRTWDGWQSVTDSWTYASADAPTFTITVPSGAASLYGVGMRIKLNQTTDKYFIITAVADTVLTVYGGTDYTLANAAISSVYVSPMKAPLGFPLDPTKWMVKGTYSSDTTQSTPVQNTWYNIGSFSVTIPIGAWFTEYSTHYRMNDTATAAYGLECTLSTGNNTESDEEMTNVLNGLGGAIGYAAPHANKRKPGALVLASKTVYYLNVRTTDAGVDSIILRGATVPVTVTAVCAYL